MAPLQLDNLIGSPGLPFSCKRERSDDHKIEPLSLSQTKRSKQDGAHSSHANGSEDSTTTSQGHPMMMTTNTLREPLELPLLEPVEPKENNSNNCNNNNNSNSNLINGLTFDSSNLEKSVPPGYLKFIGNLENEILNVSMERETLKIEVMRAHAMINIIQSRVELLMKENEDLRRHM